jgi:nucleotide-binding universal stress UspA family protein
MILPRPKIQQIVVPTDYSPCADQALAWAVLHAHTFGAALTIVHVVERHLHLAPAGLADEPQEGDVEADRARLEAYVAERLAGQGVEVQCVAEAGEPSLKIREIAHRLDADLIVMGTHGRSRLEDVLFGSVVEKVVHHTGCPVLAVPPLVEER